MAPDRKYELDLTSLQYKLVRLPWKTRLNRFLMYFGLSVIISVLYISLFKNTFGSPKEKMLEMQLENMKLQYSLLRRQMAEAESALSGFRLSDEKRYRPVLELDGIEESYWKGGSGGVEKYSSLKGLMNSDLLIGTWTKIDELRNKANVQSESFNAISEASVEWKRQNDHFPGISPVSVQFSLGDGYSFRPIHPVLGIPRMHNGQDFRVPYGTDVYATGDGVVVEAGYSRSGFGNYIVIDHDYGLQTLYGHLSQIKVSKGTSVKRGDLIGKSGDSGLSSGPHLHYQVEQRGRAINPRNFFNKNDLTLEEYQEMIQAFGSKSEFR